MKKVEIADIPLDEMVTDEMFVQVDPEDPDFELDFLAIGEARYELAGVCIECGKRLFVCKSHPVRADAVIGDHICNFLGEGGVTCLEHDPNKAHREKIIPKPIEMPDGTKLIPG